MLSWDHQQYSLCYVYPSSCCSYPWKIWLDIARAELFWRCYWDKDEKYKCIFQHTKMQFRFSRKLYFPIAIYVRVQNLIIFSADILKFIYWLLPSTWRCRSFEWWWWVGNNYYYWCYLVVEANRWERIRKPNNIYSL